MRRRRVILGYLFAVPVCVLLCLGLSAHEYQVNPSKRRGSEGFFPVCYGSKWGFIGRDGKLLISPRFERVGSFSMGWRG